MGVKSTTRLTRAEAEDLYFRLKEERFLRSKERRLEIAEFSDTELEDILEKWNDELHDGEGYENYIVSEYKW